MRTFVLSSDFGVSLDLRVAEDFVYLGADTFTLKRVAAVARHHFIDGTPPRRMIVVQLEAFLAGVDDVYRYALRDPITLGGVEYGRTSFELRLSDAVADEPDAEVARTVSFLERKRILVGDGHAVARYARILGDERRSEVLIFFHEIGGTLDGIDERARRAFEVPAPQG